MNLFILRHGLATELSRRQEDAERPLTAKGERKTREAAAAMKAMKLSFDLILSSPLVRADQTARIVAKKLGFTKRPVITNALIPGEVPKMLLQLLAKSNSEDVLIVGHEPNLSRLISLLISGGERALLDLKKGGLAKLSVSSLNHGKRASLEWLLTPRQLKLLARS